jgi:alpha-glucosidase
MTASRQPWWSGGVLYQVYPRSFADSNGDGIGDLAGLRGRLDYLQWLGIDGIWLNPTFPSPNRDWGYDVSDYFDVHPDLGTLDDLDAVIAAAGELGIRILLDLVPAHTSDQHHWFVESRSSRESSRRPWYIWADEADEQESVFGGRTWTSTSGRVSTTTTSSWPSNPTSTGCCRTYATPSTRSCASGSTVELPAFGSTSCTSS